MIRFLVTLSLLPRNLAIGVLVLYRAIISPLYGRVCRFHPSCSQYALTAVQNRGVIVGAGLGIIRILRCNPWSSGGIDDPPPARNSAYELGAIGFVKVKVR